MKEPGWVRRGPVPLEPLGHGEGAPAGRWLAGLTEGWACITAMTDAPGRAPWLPPVLSCMDCVRPGGHAGAGVDLQTPRVHMWLSLGHPSVQQVWTPHGPVFPDSTQQPWPSDGPSSQHGSPAWEKFTPPSSLRPCKRPCPRLAVAMGAVLLVAPEPAGGTGASPYLAASAHTWIVFAWLLWFLLLEETGYRVALEI